MINPAHTKQAVPMVAAVDGSPLLCVSEMKLLGLIFDDSLTWWPLVNDLTGRTRRKIWALHRLREAGASTEVLKVNYVTRVRSILEYGAVVWGCVISGLQAKNIEKVQMNALQVVLGAESRSYEANLRKLELEKLSVRRESLIHKFAISTFRNPEFRSWYKPTPHYCE